MLEIVSSARNSLRKGIFQSFFHFILRKGLERDKNFVMSKHIENDCSKEG